MKLKTQAAILTQQFDFKNHFENLSFGFNYSFCVCVTDCLLIVCVTANKYHIYF